MTEQPVPEAQLIEDSLEVKLLWPFGMTIPSVYANQASVTRTANEVILEFGEFLPTGMSNRTKEDVSERAKTLEVRVVARVIMSPQGYSVLANLIGRIADRDAKEPKEGENE